MRTTISKEVGRSLDEKLIVFESRFITADKATSDLWKALQ